MGEVGCPPGRKARFRSPSFRIGLIVIHGLHIDAVVLHMCSDELHPDDFRLVLHVDDEPMLVAAHVQYDAVVTADARARELILDVLRTAPPCPKGFLVPAVERASRISATGSLPELLQAALCDHPHRPTASPISGDSSRAKFPWSFCQFCPETQASPPRQTRRNGEAPWSAHSFSIVSGYRYIPLQ